MSIVFFCQSCGARFEAESRMAGKRGHCERCGQLMEIPRAEQLASMASIPALVAAGASAIRDAGGSGPTMSSWLNAAATNVGLAEVMADRMPIGLRKKGPATPLDNAEDSRPYVLNLPERKTAAGPTSRAAGASVRAWRREVGLAQRLTRWLTESAYLISVPFLIVLLVGVMVRSRDVALFGATFVVLLNLGRLVAGAANLALDPLRDGLNTNRMKPPLRRVLEPVVTITLVALAFTFAPWLSEVGPAGGGLAGRIESTAKGLGKEMERELRTTADRAQAVEVEKPGYQVREGLRTVGAGPGEGSATAPEVGGPRQPAGSAIGDLIKGVGDHARQAVEESRQQP